MLKRGHIGDGCELASTLCQYALRKDDIFVLRWISVRRVRPVSVSSANMWWRCAQYSIIA